MSCPSTVLLAMVKILLPCSLLLAASVRREKLLIDKTDAHSRFSKDKWNLSESLWQLCIFTYALSYEPVSN